MGYRDFYSFTYSDYWNYYRRLGCSERESDIEARRHRRMSAGLFNRDCRKILLNDSCKCAFCGSIDSLTMDHIIPVCQDGPNELSNIQILCLKCNLTKNGKTST